MTGLRSPYKSLLRQWNANSRSRQNALVRKIRAMVEQYATVAQPMESYMSVAYNEFANSLDDIDSDDDCQRYQSRISTSHNETHTKERTPLPHLLTPQAAEEDRPESSRQTHVNNVRPLLINSTEEVESENPTKKKSR
ncbi:hypothetical protein NX059_012269 [Plenodomus lindquistii]|nr:hypothetical protein NX059_012269 [Plenodomus lindquistii]